jgi:hypothetical protein
LQYFPEYYAEYAGFAPKALARAHPVKTLRERDAKALDDSLKDHNLKDDAVKYLPLRAPKKDAAVLIDARTGMPVATVLIDPW